MNYQQQTTAIPCKWENASPYRRLYTDGYCAGHADAKTSAAEIAARADEEVRGLRNSIEALTQEHQRQMRETECKAMEAENEIERLKAGRFTPEEFQNLCHTLHPSCSPEMFATGCEAYQEKLFEYSPTKEARDNLRKLNTAQSGTIAKLQHYIADWCHATGCLTPQDYKLMVSKHGTAQEANIRHALCIEKLREAEDEIRSLRRQLADVETPTPTPIAPTGGSAVEPERLVSDERADKPPLSGCHDAEVYYSLEHDNFYCSVCRAGQGNEFYAVAKDGNARKLLRLVQGRVKRLCAELSQAQKERTDYELERNEAQKERTEAMERVGQTKRFYEQRITALEHLRPLCPDCRDKCKGETCLRCQIQRLTKERDEARAEAMKSVREELHRALFGILFWRGAPGVSAALSESEGAQVASQLAGFAVNAKLIGYDEGNEWLDVAWGRKKLPEVVMKWTNGCAPLDKSEPTNQPTAAGEESQP